MNPGMTRWKDEPLYPNPFSPVLEREEEAARARGGCKNEKGTINRSMRQRNTGVGGQDHSVCTLRATKISPKGTEVLSRLGDDIGAQLHGDPTSRLAADGNVEVALGIGP